MLKTLPKKYKIKKKGDRYILYKRPSLLKLSAVTVGALLAIATLFTEYAPVGAFALYSLWLNDQLDLWQKLSVHKTSEAAVEAKVRDEEKDFYL